MDGLDALSIDALDEFDLTDEAPEDFSTGILGEDSPDNTDTFENSNEDSEPIDNGGENNEPGLEDAPSRTSTEELTDFTEEVLRLKGIVDPTKIKFLDESGAIVEKDWDSLTREEQLTILTQEGNPETDLEDPEIELINAIRNSGMTVQNFLYSLLLSAANKAVELYENSILPPARIYEIDSLEDDELFALDLLEKVGEENITDEELQDALEKAKENETLYLKLIDALRVQYKTLEDENILRHQEEEAALAEQQYQNFSNDILNLIEGFDTVAGQEIELSIDDKNDLANFILTRDENGVTDFGKAMNNPQTLTTVAFWALKGPEIMYDLQNLILEAYKRGFAEGKLTGAIPAQKTTPLVVQPQHQKVSEPVLSLNNNTHNIYDALSAFGDDESYLYN